MSKCHIVGNLMHWLKYSFTSPFDEAALVHFWVIVQNIRNKYERTCSQTLTRDIEGVKKVRSAIKVCSYFFSYNVSNDINVTVILYSLLTLQEINNGMFNKILCHVINDLQNQGSSKMFGLEELNRVYDKEPL